MWVKLLWTTCLKNFKSVHHILDHIRSHLHGHAQRPCKHSRSGTNSKRREFRHSPFPPSSPDRRGNGTFQVLRVKGTLRPSDAYAEPALRFLLFQTTPMIYDQGFSTRKNGIRSYQLKSSRSNDMRSYAPINYSPNATFTDARKITVSVLLLTCSHSSETLSLRMRIFTL